GGWTGSGSLTDSAVTADTVTASKNAGFTLTNTSLSSTDGMTLGLSGITKAGNTTLTNTSLAVTGLPTLTLSGITAANLTDTTGGNTFTVSGWTGTGSLTDNASAGDTVTAS